MILAKLDRFNWLELVSDTTVELHFGQISIGMSKDDFIILASMFDLSSGSDMPDESICSVCEPEDGQFILAYRSFKMRMCTKVLSRFSKLCLNGATALDRLHDIKTGGKKYGHLYVI